MGKGTRRAKATSVAALTARQVRMASSPLATLTELSFEACGRPKGSPSSWPVAVREALWPGDLALLGPVFCPGGPPYVPDCLVPRPASHLVSFDDELDRLAAVAADQLAMEIEADGVLGSPWSMVARAPRRWLDGYVPAMRRAWSAVEPLWRRAAPLMEREVERVGVALARGALDQVIDGLHRSSHVHDDRWFLYSHPLPETVAEDLVLAPMVIGSGALLVTTERDAVTYVAYPLPGARRVAHHDGDLDCGAGGAGLEVLLGGPRATILRRLDQPVTAGRLSADLQLAPGAITHHLRALERAGLITRERDGRNVVVHRRARGTSLLHLYER
jgi:hypothetical protein